MTDDQYRIAPFLGFGMAFLGIVLVCGSVVVRLTTPAITFSWFDVDPTTVDHAAFGMLPWFSFIHDAIMLIGAALVFGGMALRGSGVSWWVLLLAVIPIPILLWHGWNDPADLEQGSLWMVSILAGVALAHAASDDRLRVVSIAIVLAGLAPVVIRAIAQVAWEIPDTIAYFEANRSEVLAMRGLEPDSSAARVLERRLMNAAPTAWFDSANLLASVMAAGAAAWFAITLSAVRNRLASGVSGLCGFIAIAMIAIVIASGSVGGIVVLVLGLGFAAASQFMPNWTRYGGWVALALVFLALFAAPLGSMLGDLPGGKSLVIRSGYVAGAAEIMSDAPLVGVGPGEFRQAWLQVRSPGSPEEIVSPHAMPWDWVATIGLLSLTWVALVLAGLWWGSRACRLDPDPKRMRVIRMTAIMCCLIVGFGFNYSQLPEMLTLGSTVMAVRLLGWFAFIATAILLAWLWRHVSRGIMLGLSAAAVVLVVHAQVEMTIQQATTVPWLLAVVGLSAPCLGSGSSRRGRIVANTIGTLGALVSVGLAVLVIIIGQRPSFKAERMVGISGSAIQRSLDITHGTVGLSRRESAATDLLEAASIRDDDRIRLMAAEQLWRGIYRAVAMETPADVVHVEEARQRVLEISLDVFARTGSIEAGHLAIEALMARGDTDSIAAAVLVAEEVADRDPSGLWSQRHLADVLWEAGDRDVSIEVYRRVLELDDARGIDPLRRLNSQDRVLLEERIADFLR